MHKVGVALAALVLPALPLAACSSSPSSRFTALDPGKTFSSLSAGERQQFCEDRAHYMSTQVPANDEKKITCSRSAGTAGTGSASDPNAAKTACQAVYQACMNAPEAAPQSSCDSFATGAAGCGATVDEATQCAEAQADALEKLASSADATCDDLGKAPEKSAPAKTPEACSKVERLCPKIFEDPLLNEAQTSLPKPRP